MCSALAETLFVIGVIPGYMFELELTINDVADRCPAGGRTEGGFDCDCAERLIHHGPLFLGVHELSASFVLGLGSLVGMWLALGDHRARRTLILMAAVTYLGTWTLLVAWNAQEGARFERIDIEIFGFAE